jgi:hypothetical protein
MNLIPLAPLKSEDNNKIFRINIIAPYRWGFRGSGSIAVAIVVQSAK